MDEGEGEGMGMGEGMGEGMGMDGGMTYGGPDMGGRMNGGMGVETMGYMAKDKSEAPKQPNLFLPALATRPRGEPGPAGRELDRPWRDCQTTANDPTAPPRGGGPTEYPRRGRGRAASRRKIRVAAAAAPRLVPTEDPRRATTHPHGRSTSRPRPRRVATEDPRRGRGRATIPRRSSRPSHSRSAGSRR